MLPDSRPRCDPKAHRIRRLGHASVAKRAGRLWCTGAACVFLIILHRCLADAMSTLASAGAAGAVAAPPVQSWRLEKEQELRFEAGKTPISLKLLKGQAESFGAEIVRDSVYKFADANVGVFTWHGCTIEVVGEVSAAYISRETPMRLYVNCHAALEQKRRLAKSSGGTGPRVLLVGPPDVGKTTIARILANYGARQGSQPLYVDLDVSEVRAAGDSQQPRILTPSALSTEQFVAQPCLVVMKFTGLMPFRRRALPGCLAPLLLSLWTSRLT